jgi:hypothetical protein
MIVPPRSTDSRQPYIVRYFSRQMRMNPRLRSNRPADLHGDGVISLFMNARNI